MTQQPVKAIVDCGSSYYIIVYKHNGAVKMIDICGNEVQTKVPSTAYLPTQFVDIKKPPYKEFYFGDAPQQNQELAFIPNWKNYFFDADEVVYYPNVPSVPSKNHRSVRVLASVLFEAFMARAVQTIYSQTNGAYVHLYFLIPSVASDTHHKFLEECVRAVKNHIDCKIDLMYEARAATLACGDVAIGDFGGFTFDKASGSHHEACNLAASNIDQVVEQLIRADFIDLRFRNRNVLYDRIMRLKEDYREGDVVLSLNSVFYPFYLLQHKLTVDMEHDPKRQDFDYQTISTHLEGLADKDRTLLVDYYREMKKVLNAYQMYSQFRLQCLQMLKLVRHQNIAYNSEVKAQMQEFFVKYKVTPGFYEIFSSYYSRQELKELLKNYYDFEHIVNDHYRVTELMLELIQQWYQGLSEPELPEIAYYMYTNQFVHWYAKINTAFKLRIQSANSEYSGNLVKEYVFDGDNIAITLPELLYKSIINAVCNKIVDNFAYFIYTSYAKDFVITGNFSKSPYLLYQIVDNQSLAKILSQNAKGSEKKDLLNFLYTKKRRSPEEILRKLLDVSKIDKEYQSIKTKYSHYILDMQGALKYIEAAERRTYKNRICIDEGTSGSLLSYLPANAELTSQLNANCLPPANEVERRVDNLLYKAGTKAPSFCVVNVAMAFSFACQRYKMQISQLTNGQQMEEIINRYFNEQLLSLTEIYKIFSYDMNYDSVKASSQFTAAEAAIPQGRMTARQKLEARKMGKLAQAVVQATPAQTNEPLIIEYWKRYLYAKQYVKFPFEPTFKQRYTFNGQSINIDFPIAYFYIAHLIFFYKIYQAKQQDMVSFYNQTGITLTVPCAAKQCHLTFLRECARLANLPDDLVFVYEPNSAFSYLFYRDLYNNTNTYKNGQYILVLDVGGGTTDISLLLVKKDDKHPDQATFSVINFYEINYAGNNVINEVINRLGIRMEQLEPLSSTAKSSLRESIKFQIEALTNQQLADVKPDEFVQITISNYQTMSKAEREAYEELKNQMLGKVVGNPYEQKGIISETFYIPNSIIIEGIENVQKKIFEKSIEFCVLNKSIYRNYIVSIVCVGGMGSSTYFSQSLNQHVRDIRSQFPYIFHLEVGNQQSSVAQGGLYLKAEKDYVDFAAPFISRGTEEEDKFIKQNDILRTSDVSLITFINEDLRQRIQRFIFIQNGQRWLKSDDGKSDKLFAQATHMGIEMIIFVEYCTSQTIYLKEYYGFLVRVPLDYLNELHPHEEMCEAGVPYYLYSINCTLVEADATFDDGKKKPFAAINIAVSVAGTEGPSIHNKFNLFYYYPRKNKGLLLKEFKDSIYLVDTIQYPKIAPFLKTIEQITKENKRTMLFRDTWVVKLPNSHWRIM